MQEMKPSLWHYLRAVFAIPLAFLVLAISIIPITAGVVFSAGRARSWIIEHVGPLLARLVLRIVGVRFTMFNKPADSGEPMIYISNHSSTLDLFMIIALGLPRVRFIAKYELQYNPIFFALGRVTGQIFIDRSDTDRAVRVLQRAYAYIRQHQLSIYVAPEGTRKHDARVGPFKKGAFRMAIELGYPIVPVYFGNARNLCSGSSIVVRPGTVSATFHPAINTSGWKLETLDQHIADVRQLYVDWDRQEAQTGRVAA